MTENFNKQNSDQDLNKNKVQVDKFIDKIFEEDKFIKLINNNFSKDKFDNDS